MQMRRLSCLLGALAIGAALVACGGQPETPPTPTPTAAPPTASPVPEATATTPAPTATPVPTPTQAPASVSGTVSWGSQPVAGAVVELRAANGDAVVATTQAGAAGQFLLAGVPPGTYALAARWPDGTENAAVAHEVTLEPGAASADVSLALVNQLVLTEPDLNAAPTLPTIAWESDAEDGRYHVTVVPAGEAEPVVDVMVAGTSLDVNDQLEVARPYVLTVELVDGEGASLARFVGEMTTQAEPTPPRAVVLPDVCNQSGLPTYIDRAQGICFAYPQDHVMTGEADSPTIVGPPVAAGAVVSPTLMVEALPGEGLDLAQWVDAYLDGATDDPSAVDRVATTVGGLPAEILEPVPGEPSVRQVALANGNEILLLTFSPTFRDVPAEEQDFIQRKGQVAADNLFEVVVATLATLSPPEGVARGTELPAACIVDGMGLNVDRASGLCVAIPVGYTAQRTPQGLPRLIGPALDEKLSPMRATFAVEPLQPIEGRTLDEVVADYVKTAGGDDTTQSEITIGGEPAVLVEHLPAGRGSQEIFVLQNGQVYHLIFQPDPAVVEIAAADMARLMETVIASFSFLELGE